MGLFEFYHTLLMPKKVAVLGAHMSIAKGFVEAAQETVASLGANALQIFLKSPRGRGKTKLTDEEAGKFRAYCDANGVRFVVAHCSYLLNFAKPMDANSRWPLDSLIEDLRSMEKLNGHGVVLHVGKNLELSFEDAEKYLIENLKVVLNETADTDQPILLENTAGQGTEMGYTFEQLRSFYEKLGKPDRVKFCLDTCHMFAAGYDLRTPAAVRKTMDEIERLIGLDRVQLFHFNDSKKDLGSRVDRHEILNEGFIGNGLKTVAKFARDHEIPMILETPEKTRTHKEDLQILKGWL